MECKSACPLVPTGSNRLTCCNGIGERLLGFFLGLVPFLLDLVTGLVGLGIEILGGFVHAGLHIVSGILDDFTRRVGIGLDIIASSFGGRLGLLFGFGRAGGKSAREGRDTG